VAPRDRPLVRLRRTVAYRSDSSENLCELEQISPRIGEESELSAYDGKIKRLCDDCHAATPKLIHCGVDAVNHEAEVVPARKVEAVGEIAIWLAFDGTWTGEQFQLGGRINGSCHICELEISVRPPMDDTKVELFGVPSDCFVDVGYANRDVIGLHRSERARGLGGGERGRHAHLLPHEVKVLTSSTQAIVGSPNGLRLGGERSRAERVRCSRGLGGGVGA